MDIAGGEAGGGEGGEACHERRSQSSYSPLDSPVLALTALGRAARSLLSRLLLPGEGPASLGGYRPRSGLAQACRSGFTALQVLGP